jgi:hypothetical protein
LEDLHLAIIDAIDFYDDHLYAFYISRTERSRDKRIFDEDNGGIFDVTIEFLKLTKAEKGRQSL